MVQQPKKIDNITVKVEDMERQSVHYVRNLGYFMDCFMIMPTTSTNFTHNCT